MTWRIAALTCIVFGSGLLLYFANQRVSITNYPPREGPIVAFGDSLVYGTGASEGNDFAALLSRSLGSPIENMGVPGDTTGSALARLPAVLEKRPGVVIVLLGGNDYLRRLPREETFRNLETIVTTLQKDGALVVVLGIRGGVLRDNYSDEFDALASRTGAAYVRNVLDGIIDEPKLMSDQIHPNDAGYMIIAQKVLPELSALLK